MNFLRNPTLLLVLCLMAYAASPSILADEETPAEAAAARSRHVCMLEGTNKWVTAYVDLDFTVTTEGTVRDVTTTRTEVCEDEDTEKARAELEKAAIKAVLKFKYKPRIIDDEPVDVAGVTTRITFIREDDPDEEADSVGEFDDDTAATEGAENDNEASAEKAESTR